MSDLDGPPAGQPAVPAPDFAVPARLIANTIDSGVVCVLGASLTAALATPLLSRSGLITLSIVQFVYFFGQEAWHGQTLGKRLLRLRVVTRGHQRPALKQIVIRNVLRIVDEFPLLYASGLLSMLRSGATRRQRIGDIAAETLVVHDARVRNSRRPSWILKLAAVMAIFASASAYAAWLTASRHEAPVSGRRVSGGPALLPPQQVATGFPGLPTGSPRVGTWRAIGVITGVIGYSGVRLGQQYHRVWAIQRRCLQSVCGLVLTRAVAAGRPIAARLIRESDGWHARFADWLAPCAQRGAHVAFWLGHQTMVLRFIASGRRAVAHERNYSYGSACGSATETLTWDARAN